MTFDASAFERLRQALADRADVVERRMVGGRSFLVAGQLCCGITGAALMVRVGPDAFDRALARPYARPMVLAGRRLTGYVCVEPPGYATDEALAAWVQQALDLVATRRVRPRGRSRGR